MAENQQLRKYALLALLLTSFTLFVSSLPNRAIFIDDHWFAEQAYWLVNEGVVRSELFSGLLNYEVQQLAYHKLHIWQAAFILDTFGLSPYALKSTGLFFFACFIVLLFVFFRTNFSKKDSSALFLIAAALLFSNAFLVEQTFNYRPEPAMMLFGFGSFMILYFTLTKPQPRHDMMILSGALAAIAVLYHLNGAIYILSGVFLLVYFKQYRYTVTFMIAALTASSFYFVDIVAGGDFSTFFYQLKNDPAIADSEFGIWQYPVNVITEVKHVFRHPKEGTYSLLFIVLTIINWRNIRTHKGLWFVFMYFITLFVALAAISPGKRDPNYYLLLHMPYAAILMAHSLHQIHAKSLGIKTFVLTLVFFYGVTNYAHTIKLVNQEKPTAETNRKMMLALGIKPGKSVAGPVSLVFNEIENIKLHGVRTFFVKSKQEDKELSVESFFCYMSRKNIDYVILPELYKNELRIVEPAALERTFGYRFIKKYPDVDRTYYVFEKTHPPDAKSGTVNECIPKQSVGAGK